MGRTIDIDIVLPRRRTGDAFEESKHPRQGGKFASAGGGAKKVDSKSPEGQAALVKQEKYKTSSDEYMKGVVHNQHNHEVGAVHKQASGKYSAHSAMSSSGIRKHLGEHSSEKAAHEAIRQHRLSKAGKLLPRSLTGAAGPAYNGVSNR